MAVPVRHLNRCLIAILVSCMLLAPAAVAEEHHYKKGDVVPLLANKVGPYANPSETYQYYTLPFCQPEEGKKYVLEDLGEVLEGDRLVSTPHEIKFGVDAADEELCTKALSGRDLDRLRYAIGNDYYFQMFFDDDLPVYGFVGKLEHSHAHGLKDGLAGEARVYLFTHFHFDIAYNGDQVIELNVSTVSADPNKTLDITGATDGRRVRFSYSARWVATDRPFEERMDRYTRYSFLPEHLEIHWFSIVNSCVTVLLLTGFLATILVRVLKADFVKFSRDPRDPEAGAPGAAAAALDDAAADEGGWKYLHGDVFRPPPHPGLFAAFVGVGAQVLVIVAAVLALAVADTFYPYNRGAMLSACVVLYALTAGVAGYVSAVWYRKLGGRQWVPNVLLTAGLFCGPLLAVFSFLNTVAWVQGSTQALPAGTIVIIVAIWLVVTFPLTVLGAIWGKNSGAELDAPCRTTKFPREVPELPWYRGAAAQMLMAGFLPFSAIYVELYYVFASIWGHKVLTIYSILAVVFAILVIVTAFITVALTYFQLAAEDHRWWWRSFLCGGSTALFVFAYCVFYYHARSDMSGFMQASFFFGYNAVACYAFFLMLGTVGWWSARAFVWRIFRAVKVE